VKDAGDNVTVNSTGKQRQPVAPDHVRRKKILVGPSTFLPLQEVQLVVLVSAFVVVSRVWPVSWLLFFFFFF